MTESKINEYGEIIISPDESKNDKNIAAYDGAGFNKRGEIIRDGLDQDKSNLIKPIDQLKKTLGELDKLLDLKLLEKQDGKK